MDDHIFSLFQWSTRFNYTAALVQNPAGFFLNKYFLRVLLCHLVEWLQYIRVITSSFSSCVEHNCG